MSTIITRMTSGVLAAALLLLAACGSGVSIGSDRSIPSIPEVSTLSFTVGGSISGLAGSVELQNNLGDNLTLSANGNFVFASKINNGSTYSVSVLTQPSEQTCSVGTGAGTVSGNNVSNVAVVCSGNAYTVGGSISGLSGSLVLQDNNGDNLTISANGTFTFASAIANGSPYSVTVLTQPSGQSCSLANNTGTITASNVTNVVLTCAANIYTIGGTVSGLNGSMVLQNNGGDNLGISSNGSFTFPTALTYGNGYSVSVLSLQYPNQACAIINDGGTITSNVNGIAINCVKFTTPHYAYTTNTLDDSVSTYVVDASTGGLTYVGKVAAGLSPYFIAVDPSGKFAYVANLGDGTHSSTVSQYTIGTNGVLAPMSTAAVAAGIRPAYVTIDTSGKYAYVANLGDGTNPGTVSQYTIGADGSLTAMSTAMVAAGVYPYAVAIDSLGKYAYVANSMDNTVSQYVIGAGGVLTAMSTATVAAGVGPNAIAVDPSGKYAYVANWGDRFNPSTISQYSIGPDGSLTAMVTATAAAGVSPYSVTVDPSGKFVYAANYGDGTTPGTVSQYTIGSDGSLTAISSATVAAGISPFSVTVDPSGKFAYVANYGDGVTSGTSTVSQYTIGSDGSLTAMSPATVADMLGASSIVVTGGMP